ncbi:hypothetical protein SDC9_121577 [bioreactor metagenome]|uniref:Uncharacterized protein n=1 Tax=bioreactor metagenome TaxID=1076179 RepID=A0A645CCC6_9ZZZZ
MLKNRSDKDFSQIILMLCHMQRSGGQPSLRKFVIHKITKIHPVCNSVHHEIHPEEKLLVIFFRVDDNRYQTKQNK